MQVKSCRESLRWHIEGPRGGAAPERHLMAFDWGGRLVARAKLAAKATSDRTPCVQSRHETPNQKRKKLTKMYVTFLQICDNLSTTNWRSTKAADRLQRPRSSEFWNSIAVLRGAPRHIFWLVLNLVFKVKKSLLKTIFKGVNFANIFWASFAKIQRWKMQHLSKDAEKDGCIFIHVWSWRRT